MPEVVSGNGVIIHEIEDSSNEVGSSEQEKKLLNTIPNPTMDVVSLACLDPKLGTLEKHIIKRKHCQPSDILIDVQYCGICHSDLHQARAEWPIDCFFPMVPGHEIAGVVEAVGSSVTKFKIGDRVSVGCFVDSCRNCYSCKDGFEQYCVKGIESKSTKYDSLRKVKNYATYNCCVGDAICADKGYPDELMYGGYSKKITVDENYVMTIPDNLDMAKAAPLACAGITTYSPLNHYGALAAGKNFTVGIVGLGGLGGMGAKLSKAMGNRCVVLSTSERKRAYAEKELGCEFCITTNKEDMKKWECTFDLIICTISANFDIHPYLDLLKPQSTFCLVGLPPNKMEIKPFAFVARRIKVVGSLIGGIKETQEMFDFCGKHNITCDIEIIHPKQINSAWEKLTKNVNEKARFVIDWSKEPIAGGDWQTDKLSEPYCHEIHADATIYGAPK